MNYKPHKYANLFPMIEKEEFENLKKDIAKQGLLTPIVLYDGQILDGRNRFNACNELGINPKLEEYKGDSPLQFVISLNLKRRHLTKQQAACVAVNNEELMVELEVEAQKRKGGDRKSDDFKSKVEKIPPLKEKKTRVVLAETFHTNDRYIQDAKKLKAEAPEEFAKVAKGQTTFQEIKKEKKIEARRRKIEKQKEEIANGSPNLPKGKFEVIAIDPPWNYLTKYSPDHYMGRSANPYPSMTQEQLKELDLPAAKDCVLWLWTTHHFIWDAKELLEHWGFEYKCILTWDKEMMGIGKWLRKQCEFCLVGVKGKPIWAKNNVRDILRESRTSHSTKPESFFKMVDELCIGRKLEYFARKKRVGWDVFGDEV